MGSGEITRRSLIALAAAGAGVAVRSRPASARFLADKSVLAGLPFVSSGLQAAAGQPPIIARRAWAQGGARPRVAPEYGTVQLAFVHHTENPDGYSAAEVPAMLRSIYEFHRYGRGWNDIGYNFAIDRFGRIFEARAGGIDEPVVGAHAGGYNVYSTGIAILGTYGAQRISPAARTALEHLLAWKLSLHGAPLQGRVTVRVTTEGAVYSRFPAHAHVSLPRVAGHRDADSTDCPGDALYGELQSVRGSSEHLVGLAGRATLRLWQPEAPGAASTLVGSLRLADGTPLAGSPLKIQARQVSRRGETVAELTVAETLTDSSGQWSLPIALSAAKAETSLRVLCSGAPGVPTVLSPPLSLAGYVSFTPSSPAPSSSPAPAEAPTPSAQAPAPSSPESPSPAV